MSYYIIIRGPLGCGKTTISEELSRVLGAKHIAIDRILDKNSLLEDKEDGYISQASFNKANEIACCTAKPLLENDVPVIFDGNFYWESQLDDLVRRLDFPHHIFTLKASLDICIDRDRKRKHAHGEKAARAVYAKTAEFDRGVLVDASLPLVECIKKILSFLENPQE